jgi:DNA polymerase-1
MMTLITKNPHKFHKMGDSGLKTLAPQICKRELPTFAETTDGKHFDELDSNDQKTIDYACADSDIALQLYHKINAWFDKQLPLHRNIVEQIESPTAVYCGLMKCNGVNVDEKLMHQKDAEITDRLAKLRKGISLYLGDTNIGANASTAAFKQALYEDLELPQLKTTAANKESADDETLQLLKSWCSDNKPELVPLFEKVQELKRLNKIQSTYIAGYLKFMNKATGKIHADLLPLATETGRFASRNPNLQNMPRSGKDDIGVRNFIKADDGNMLLSLDFSQIELRVGAFYCRDSKMLETYANNGDIHDSTATVVFGAGEHNKEQRTIAKNVNFGIFYGISPKGLQHTLKFKAGVDLPLEQCERIAKNLKSGYPQLAEWQKAIKQKARTLKYSETWLGRRRYLFNINSTIRSFKAFAERCALNTPIQGTAADILKIAIARLLPVIAANPWIKPILQIHDELVFEVPKERVAEAIEFIKTIMEQKPFDGFDVPLLADAAVGERFGNLKEFDTDEK